MALGCCIEVSPNGTLDEVGSPEVASICDMAVVHDPFTLLCSAAVRGESCNERATADDDDEGATAGRLATRPEIKNPLDASTPSGASWVSVCEYGQSAPFLQSPMAKKWQMSFDCPPAAAERRALAPSGGVEIGVLSSDPGPELTIWPPRHSLA